MGIRSQIVSVVLFLSLSIGTYLNRFGSLELFTNSSFFLTYGLVLLVLGHFLIERHFTKQRDVVVNCIAVIAGMLAMGEVALDQLRKVIIIGTLLLLVLSVTSILLTDSGWNKKSRTPQVLRIMRRVTSFLGGARVLFSVVFFYCLFEFNEFPAFRQDHFLFVLIWAAVLSWEPVGLANLLDRIWSVFSRVRKDQVVGRIVRSRSPDIVYCELEEDVKVASRDLVRVKLKKTKSKDLYGIILNVFFLDDKNWANIRLLSDLPSQNVGMLYSKSGDVVRVNDCELDENAQDLLCQSHIYGNRDSILGVVDVNSSINRIRVQITNPEKSISYGTVVFVDCDGHNLYYQITSDTTNEENLAESNLFGYVTAGANQLGFWNEDETKFVRHDWVPDLNSAVLVCSDSEFRAEDYHCPEGSFLVGSVPNSRFPVLADISNLVQHHYCALGITGCGKTTYELDLIKEKIALGVKVICFDITGDYMPICDKMNIRYERFYTAGDEATLKDDFDKMDKEEMKGFKGLPKIIENCDKNIEFIANEATCRAFDSEIALFIVQIEELANTASVHELCYRTLNSIFLHKKKHPDKSLVSIVFEEAHTLIPERSSSTQGFGKGDKIVNKIAQITLQGRKYGIGFAVLTQRTANVAKTVLNQCNTIFSFACFDRTGIEFLSNYYGDEYARILPNLGKLQLLAAGKAINADLPIVVQRPIKTNEELIDMIEVRKAHSAANAKVTPAVPAGDAADGNE